MTASVQRPARPRARAPLAALSAVVRRVQAARMAALLHELPDHRLEAMGITRAEIDDHARRLTEEA